jgi:hypothetical protein
MSCLQARKAIITIYLMQYSISNLNAFIILISIGFSLYFYCDVVLGAHIIEQVV